MTNTDKKNDGVQVNHVATAAVGVAVGAGLTMAGAMALKDKKVAQQAKKVGKELEEKAGNYTKKVKAVLKDGQEEMKKRAK